MKTSHWHLTCKELPPQPPELKGRKTVLIEPMQGSELQRQTGGTVRQKARGGRVRITAAEANAAGARALFR